MQAALVVFTSQQISKLIVLATLGGWLEWQHFFCKLSLILTASFTKIQGDVEPGSAQQLCGILCVTFAKLAGSEKLLYLLFCNRLFVDYWASFSLLCVLPTNGIEDLVCSFKCRVSNNGPRPIGGCLRYRSIAARIVRRDETLKSFPSFCFTAA